MENRPSIVSLILKLSELERQIEHDIEEKSKVMKYKVKDPHLATVLKNNGYDEKEISRRCYMAFHGLECDGQARFHLSCGGVLTLTKGHVEKIPTYTPGEWNEYPAVKPPKAAKYLVTIEGIIGASWVDIAKWSGKWWEVNQGERVLAFRERPEPYKPGEDK